MTPAPGCRPEQVTGYVDGALDPRTRAEIEDHLAGCAACRAQADEEQALRARLSRDLPAIPLPPALEARVRAGLREDGGLRWRPVLAAAAAMLLALSGLRTLPSVLAWEVARDHRHCFREERLPATVWSSDADAVVRWFASEGHALPWVPEAADGLGLVGGRLCPLPGLNRAAHVYYGGAEGRASLFVVERTVWMAGDYGRTVLGEEVRLLHREGLVLAVVGERAEDVAALERALTTTVARLHDTGLTPRDLGW